MALGQNRRRLFVRGLSGAFAIRELEPSTAQVFSNVGFHKDVTINQVPTMVDIVDAAGRLVDSKPSEMKYSAAVSLLQTSKEEIDAVANATGKLYAVRYYGQTGGGSFQYYCWPVARITPSVSLSFKAGERVLPLNMLAVKDVSVPYDVPEIILAETAGDMYLDNLAFWTSPRLGLNRGSSRLLDISGFGRHGQLSADYGNIWGSATDPVMLTFDGTNDNVDFGDVLDITAGSSLLIEAWVSVLAPGQQEILAKKQSAADASLGYALYRTAGGVAFTLADDVGQITLNGMLNTNEVHHVAVAYTDSEQQVRLYVDGSMASSDSTSAIDLSGSSQSLLFAATGDGNYGNVKLGDVRFHLLASNTDIGEMERMIQAHFGAERSYYGV